MTINQDALNTYGGEFNGLNPVRVDYTADVRSLVFNVLQARFNPSNFSQVNNKFNIRFPGSPEQITSPVELFEDSSRLTLDCSNNQQLVSPSTGNRGRWFDLSTINSGLKGFTGGFTDGTYAYYVPYYTTGWQGRVVRVALNNFTAGGTEWFDLATINSGLRGFQDGFTDGTYAYYVPYYDGAYHGRVVRVALNNFTAGGTEWFDLTTVDSGLKGFNSGFTDGTYAYYAPLNNGALHGRVVRVALNNFTVGGTEWFDLATVNSGLKGFYGGFTDGTYAYYVPYYDGAYHGRVVRVALNNFTAGGLVASVAIGVLSARVTSGYCLSVCNDNCLVYAVFSDAGLTTLSHWVYVGWLKDSQYNSIQYPRNFVVITNSDGGRIAQENINIASVPISRDQAIANPAIDCVTPTPGADSTDILFRDDVGSNNYIGKLWNMMRLPSSAVVGKIYRNTGIDPDTGVVETDQKAYWMCVGTWGTDKIGMRVWTENII